jgi:hypothetical protein
VTAGDIAGIITAFVALLALAGGYVQFVLRRSGLGYVEFDVEFTSHHRGQTQSIGELDFVIKNVGSSMVIVEKLQCRVRYRICGAKASADGVEPAFEHLLEPVGQAAGTFLGEHWFYVMETRTFIQPGVTQRYRKPVVVPSEAEVLHVWGAFDYKIQIKGLTRALIGLAAPPPPGIDWREGIRAHTVRRTFSLDAPRASR